MISTINISQISTNIVQVAQPGLSAEERSSQKVSSSQDNKVSYWNLLHLITILGASTVALLPQMLVPRHHPIFYPEYWLEGMAFSLIASITSTMKSMVDYVAFTNEKSLMKFGVLLRIFVCKLVPYVMSLYVSRYSWTTFTEFQPPMPFTGNFLFLGAWIIYLCCLWFGVMFPSELRTNTEFRKKIRVNLVYELWWFVMNIQKDALSWSFNNISGNFQFIFALLIPLLKELNKRIMSKLVYKMAGKDNERASALLAIELNLHYAFFIAIRLNGAEIETVVCIITVDILMHLWMTRQIVRIHRVNASEIEGSLLTDKDREKAVMKIVMAELIEGIVPLAYAIGFTMAFFGPNGKLIGDVLADIWTYEKVDDVRGLYFNQILLFGVDCLSVLLNGIILAKFGNVNLFQEFCKVLNNYWMILAIVLVHLIVGYFALNDLSGANDMTNEFEWITTDGRIRMIQNSTYLSDDEKSILLAN